MELQLARLEGAMQWAEETFAVSDEIQSIDTLIHRLDVLCASLPFANAQMAIAKKNYNKAKNKAYNTYITS